MAELIDKWDVVSNLISLENEYQFFKGSEFALDAEKLYRRICEMEIGIGKTQGIEVVRCKDCKKRYKPNECPMCILVYGEQHDFTQENGYCDRGERRTDDRETV